MSLLQRTETMLDELLKTGVSLRQIARNCDGEVDYEWLKKFSGGKIGDPSVNRIQALHDCLKTMSSNSSEAL